MKYNRLSLEEFLGDLSSQINPSQPQIKIFKELLDTLHKTDPKEGEEHQKNEINDFLKNTFDYKINTKKRMDAVIYEDGQVQVIIEAKSLEKKEDFPKDKDTLESKAFYQSILYYLQEFHTENNNNLKHIILCNLEQFYIIDAKQYYQCFAKEQQINEYFKNVDEKQGNDNTTRKFYDDVCKHLPKLDREISYTYFDLTSDSADIPLIYSILSPMCLLKRKSYIDANTLNQGFYDELLYILGLCEKLENGNIIVSSDTQNTFFHSAILNLGFDREKDFEEIFSLLTTWNNRILFLRLLESMLLSFGHIKKPFFDLEIIPNFGVFNQLFFDVLAKEEGRRTEIPKGLENIPYLNSSLFEKTFLESETGKNKQIKSLDSKPLQLYKTSILKQNPQYKNKDSVPLLEYLFAFLHSYDFTTTPKDIENHTKMNFDKLINSAVLGLVFEKLNGYKEGSFYTPSFITSYMCKESITKVVIDKFNTVKNWDCKTLDDIHNKVDDIEEANKIFHTISICDPAVGSGHFLVSALNELIYIKWELGILCDEKGRKIKDINLKLINDEVVIKDSSNNIHNYTIPAHQDIESHKIQKAIFNTKRKIIENCLFGVDINPNSCEITKLRLWVELLKYSYYKDIPNRRLETLPNIDINIKAGNSLVSNIDLKITKDSLLKELKKRLNDKNNLFLSEIFSEIMQDLKNKLPAKIDEYKKAVYHYKNETNKDLKDNDKNKIKESREFILALFTNLSDEYINFREALTKYFKDYGFRGIDEANINGEKIDKNIITKLNKHILNWDLHKQKHNTDTVAIIEKDLVNLIDLMKVYENFINSPTFEWRFEFPEVLDENGDFVGFDLVIGNPPYIKQQLIKDIKPHLSKHFSIYSGTSDIYTYFFEQGYKVLKDGGILSFITSNKWTRAGYGQKLRKFILEKTSLQTYVEFNGVKVFDSATVDTSIVEFIKQTAKVSDHDFKYISITTKPKDGDDITKTTPQMINTSALSSEAFTFGDSAMIALKQKIESIGTPLKDWDISINYGIKTGYNEAFIIDTQKKDEILNACDDTDASKLPFKQIDGNYIRASAKDKEVIHLTEKERTAQIIRPILRGKDIKRYSYEWADQWVINTHNGYKDGDIKIAPIMIEDYPSLKAYLDTFYVEMSKRQDKGITPYNLRNCAYWTYFARQKIVYSEIVREPQFYLDNGDFKFGNFFAEATSFVLTGEKLNYLLGVLNSKITGAIFKNFYAGGGLGESGYRYKKAFIEKLPIPKVDENKEVSFASLVNEIIECKKENKPTKDLEEKLDEMVFDLYNLNETEIKSVLSLSLSLS